MTNNPQRPHRRSIRLHGYDYALVGAYFVTVVAQHRACLFGTIENGEMRLSPAGDMVRAVWESLPARFPHVALDAFVVMPNHVHGVIFMIDDVGAPLVGARGDETSGASTVPRATTRVAPTGDAPIVPGATVTGPDVGAPLVGARIADTGSGPITPGATTRVAPTGRPTLGDVVGAWKSLTTVAYIAGVKQAGWSPFSGRLWQRNYYEHIVRNDEDLASIRRYILTNPQNWAQDAEFSP